MTSVVSTTIVKRNNHIEMSVTRVTDMRLFQNYWAEFSAELKMAG